LISIKAYPNLVNVSTAGFKITKNTSVSIAKVCPRSIGYAATCINHSMINCGSLSLPCTHGTACLHPLGWYHHWSTFGKT